MSNQQNIGNRWLIAIMGTLLQVCLGTVYAWSVFQKLLTTAYKWTNAQAMWAFCLAICFLGLAAAWGGINLPKYGPKKLAMTGGFLFGLGYIIAAAALHYSSLVLFLLGYGVIGGCGLGLGYVTPVATAGKWFPDKKGLVTGMVVMGFGLGAAFMSIFFAPFFLSYFNNDLVKVFASLGGLFMVLAMLAASFLKNPPQGYVPEGWTPPAQSAQGQQADAITYGVSKFIFSGKFMMLWLVFCANITAGIALISLQSPILQELYRKMDGTIPAEKLVAYGGLLVAITSLFNGIGRFFWGGMSDKIGRIQTFRVMLGTQIAVFIALIFIHHPLVFGILLCYILLCYGGGFGTMPSLILDTFGAKMMAVVYGFILTAWSAAGIIGPQIIAVLKDKFPAVLEHSKYYYYFGIGILAAAFIITLVLNNSKFIPKDMEKQEK